MGTAFADAVAKATGRLLAAAALALSVAAPALAGTLLDATRLVVDAEAREGSIVIRNDADRPALVQVWIDDGRSDAPIEALDMPLQVLQPLLRLEPRGSQRIRVHVVQPQRLPADRESLYWLNVLEIPPKDAAAVAGKGFDSTMQSLEMVVRSRLKLIHRPAGLHGSPSAAAAALAWRASPAGNGVEVHNATPWLINLAEATVGRQHRVALGDGSILPLSTRTFVLEDGEAVSASAGTGVRYGWIDDLGAVKEQAVSLRTSGE